MDLNKQLVHMEKEYPSVSTEFVIEEDLIIPDSKPDIVQILLHRNDLFISETRIQDQKINICGTLHFSMLYSPEGNMGILNCIQGEIPFDEQIQMDGITASDNIQVTADVEDLNIRIINSRKCNLHALISLSAVKYELYDLSLPIPFDSIDDSNFIQKTKNLEFLELATLKKDICRIREEIRLPDNFPCIDTMLWNNVSLNDVEIIPANGKLSLSCNLQIFFIYAGEGEDRPVRYLEQTIPFSTSLECNTSEPGMVPNITYQISSSQVDVRNDSDGEARIVSTEQILDLNIRLYNENKITILEDLYHCKQECKLIQKNAIFQELCEHITSRQNIQGISKISSGNNVLQLVYPSCQLTTDTPKIIDHGIEICGSLQVQSLYLSSSDEIPYDSFTTTIPFCHQIEINDITEDALSSVMISLDKVTLSSISSNEEEINASVNYEILVTRPAKEELIENYICSDFDTDKINQMPSMVIYVVKPGDSLWKIAKHYHVSVDSIMADNNLTCDLIMPGQKLLIVR